MIKYLKIIVVILVLSTLYAPSCVNETERIKREDARLINLKKNIFSKFEIDDLNEESLFVFESTAKQKLSDLSDYLQVLTDTTLDVSFRAKAGEMINAVFLSEKMKIQLAQIDGNNEKIPVNLFINNGLENKLKFPIFLFDSIVVFKPLHKSVNNNYEGKLRFLQKSTHPSQNTQLKISVIKTADFYLIKEEKIFGIDTLNIWNVCFGDIK